MPRVAPPPSEVATVTPPPVSKNRTRFQTGDDAGVVPPADSFRAGDYGPPAAGSPAASDLRAPALAPSAGGYTGAGTLLDTPRAPYNQPSASRPPQTYNPPLDSNLGDPRGYNPAPAATSGSPFDPYRGNTLQPPSNIPQQPTYIQPAQAEQPQYQPPQYQHPTTRYSPQVANERFASAPPTNVAATISPRTTETSLPAAAVTTPLARDQWWWPYWLFLVFSLFLSIGGNLYLGWTAAEFYSRYRLAVDRLRTAGRA